MIKFLIPMLLICSCLWADTMLATAISPDKTLNEAEQVAVKNYLRGTGKAIFTDLTPMKNDYVNRYDRGTVKFNPAKGYNKFENNEVLESRNYSFHKVIIPDGTTIESVNFTQRKPDTEAIFGKNLTFIDCNLGNVKVDPTWTLVGSFATQYQRVVISQDIHTNPDGITGKMVLISHRVKDKKDGKYKEVGTDETFIPDSEFAEFMLRFA